MKRTPKHLFQDIQMTATLVYWTQIKEDILKNVSLTDSCMQNDINTASEALFFVIRAKVNKAVTSVKLYPYDLTEKIQ